MKKGKLLYLLGAVLLAGGLVAGATYAAFKDRAKVLGSTFSVGSANIMFLNDLTMGTDPTNYIEELPGPSFTNVGPGWTKDYLVKIINMGTTKLGVTSHANYETTNDPKDLRSDINVELFSWNDIDADGELDVGEEGASKGKKTIIKWKTEGFNLGDFNPGQCIYLILRFSVDTISDTKQGASAVFDFEFDSIQL